MVRKVSCAGGVKNELPQKESLGRLGQGGSGVAGFSRQFASGGKATAEGLGKLGDAWETLAHWHMEIRKCPKVHHQQSALALLQLVVVRQELAAPPGTSPAMPHSVCWLCCPPAGAWGGSLTSKALQQLLDHLQGRVISKKELTRMLA